MDLLSALRAGWWTVPLVLVASLGSAAYLVADDEPPVYRAAATLAVVPHASLERDNLVLRSVEYLERRTLVSTLSRIPEAESVRQRAAQRMETPLEELRDYQVRSAVLPSTHLIRVSVQGPDPEVAAGLANAIATVSGWRATAYYRVFDLRTLESAPVPDRPVERGEGRTYAVAGVLGLFVGVGGAYGVGLLRLAGRA